MRMSLLFRWDILLLPDVIWRDDYVCEWHCMPYWLEYYCYRDQLGVIAAASFWPNATKLHWKLVVITYSAVKVRSEIVRVMSAICDFGITFWIWNHGWLLNVASKSDVFLKWVVECGNPCSRKCLTNPLDSNEVSRKESGEPGYQCYDQELPGSIFRCDRPTCYDVVVFKQTYI